MAFRKRRPRYKWMYERQRRAKRQKAALIAVPMLVALVCAAAWLIPRAMPVIARFRTWRAASWQRSQIPEDGLSALFLDVGEADAAVLTCDGEVLVIDGGNVGDAGLLYVTLHDVLGAKRVDHMIATHPHEDHVGGLSGAIRACKVGTFYTPVEEANNAPFRITLKQAKKRGAKVVVPKPGEGFDLGGARVEFLGPRSESEDINNMSLVCRVTYGETSFLFGGDAEREEEEELVKAGAKLRADVLKVSHHGSNSSSCEAFLKKVRPRWAVISTGKSNDHDHPSQRVLNRLRSIGAAVLRTDECGTICISTDGKKITVSQFGEKS